MMRVCSQCTQESGEENAKLRIPSARREDTGKFSIKLKNEFGEDEGDINVTVIGKGFNVFWAFYH